MNIIKTVKRISSVEVVLNFVLINLYLITVGYVMLSWFKEYDYTAILNKINNLFNFLHIDSCDLLQYTWKAS